MSHLLDPADAVLAEACVKALVHYYTGLHRHRAQLVNFLVNQPNAILANASSSLRRRVRLVRQV